MPQRSPPPTDLFDQWASAPAAGAPQDAQDQAAEPAPGTEAGAEAAQATPAALRRALQELLKFGLLEQAAKPHLFRQLATDLERVNRLLEPLDLQVKLDDTRGLIFVAVGPGYQPEEDEEDEWSHPLVRRQRLTLEQSLLLAILRREFLQREQESGLGSPVRLHLDQLLPQLEIYLGSTGSDMQERKRLVNLLENLRGHGVVSEIDAQDSFGVRPMIVHLASPRNLEALLQRLREIAGNARDTGDGAMQQDAEDPQ
ncbi:DUF4194 domain-containing protein [Comamonas composti]|uniref:DUF4194 domain-containing protein n=1 Tax=Comamonas composti TaxID=408558 RepID=UPI0004271C73|nr:DUF4194 domain-containing protein [Comamonas composti]